jgi:hypothetical protein
MFLGMLLAGCLQRDTTQSAAKSDPPRFEVLNQQHFGEPFMRVGEQELGLWYINQHVGGPFVFSRDPGTLKFQAVWTEYDKDKPLQAEAAVDFISVRGKYVIEAHRIGHVVKFSVRSEYEHAVVWEKTVPIDESWIYPKWTSTTVINGMTVSTTGHAQTLNQSPDPTPSPVTPVAEQPVRHP